jgi:hypothetical protein
VHINGPFLPGEYHDLIIARGCLHYKLPRGEYYLADDGYRAQHGPSITWRQLPPHQQEFMTRVRNRHESINRRFKEFGILGKKFDYEEELHEPVFRCIAVLVQIDILNGRNIWDV